MSGYNTIHSWMGLSWITSRTAGKKYGKGKFKDDSKEFIAACREYAKKQIEKQKADFVRLGIFGDWNKSYSSMDKDVEAGIVGSLSQITKISTYIMDLSRFIGAWNPHQLWRAEVEYKDITSKAVCVNFKLSEHKMSFWGTEIEQSTGGLENLSSVSIPIWTTTPWTLPANRAVAIGSNVEYQLVDVGDSCLIIAKNL